MRGGDCILLPPPTLLFFCHQSIEASCEEIDLFPRIQRERGEGTQVKRKEGGRGVLWKREEWRGEKRKKWRGTNFLTAAEADLLVIVVWIDLRRFSNSFVSPVTSTNLLIAVAITLATEILHPKSNLERKEEGKG